VLQLPRDWDRVKGFSALVTRYIMIDLGSFLASHKKCSRWIYSNYWEIYKSRNRHAYRFYDDNVKYICGI
jgi:hypothetical protein